MKSLAQKTKNLCNNQVSRRFGKYSFQYVNRKASCTELTSLSVFKKIYVCSKKYTYVHQFWDSLQRNKKDFILEFLRMLYGSQGYATKHMQWPYCLGLFTEATFTYILLDNLLLKWHIYSKIIINYPKCLLKWTGKNSSIIINIKAVEWLGTI